MDKNEFDIDFDFEKEYGLDPKDFLNTDENSDLDLDLDLSQFEKELGIDLSEKPQAEENYADFDIGSLDLGGNPNPTDDRNPDEESSLGDEQDPDDGLNLDLDLDLDDSKYPDDDLDFDDGEHPEDDLDFDDGEHPEDDLDFGAGLKAADAPNEEADRGENLDFDEELNDDMDFSLDAGFPEEEAPDREPQANEEPENPDDQQQPKAPRSPRRRQPAKPAKPAKPKKPSVFSRLLDLYIGPLLDKNARAGVIPEPTDPNAPRPRRRKKSKMQIFKEVYLPPLIAGVALILILSFTIGSIANAIDRKRDSDETARKESQSAASEKELIAAESQRLLEEAAVLAAGYDYQAAVDKLDTFSGDMTQFQEMVTKRSEYATAQDQMVEWKDISSIPNLSFHVLIADPARAFNGGEYSGKYNRNFVTTGEFSKILQQLYDNGYVLVDYDDIIARNTGVDGTESLFPGSIFLPEGKKPVMITETLVNYFNYMIDSNDDGVADAGGSGFASRLVVDGSGDIKAEIVDINGQTQVGDYDLVPILESFIREHPDFSYRGARATLAVTGYEGVFGYRCNTSYYASKGQAYYDEQKAGAEKIAQALKDKGYTLACFTYDNVAYRGMTTTQIQADMQSWTKEVTPVLGNVDVLIFAQTSDIDDYSGATFKLLYDCGFRIFVNNGTSAKTTVENSYARQTRLMVTGNAMAWYSSQFNGLFDCNTVLDLSARGGSVPNG